MVVVLTVSLGILALLAAGQEDETASCKDRCLEKYFPGMPCYCNEACMQYENCCYDYVGLCNPKLATNDSWVNFKGHSYKYTKDGSVTAVTAQQYCRDMGALLVSINTEEEFNFIVRDVLRGRTLSAFIGGTDVVTEGTWLWADGTHMALPIDDWHVWFTGEPDNDNGVEHCSVVTNYKYWIVNKMLMKSYMWRDYNCEVNAVKEIQGYICEGTMMCNSNPCKNGGKCMYIGSSTPEYECVCKDGFLGDLCQYEVKPDEIWTICGETNLTANEGTIVSPLYPKNYPPNVRCRWLIHAPVDSTISLRLEYANIESSKYCYLDYLSVYDGHDINSSAVLFGPYCGGPVVNQLYTTSANKAAVVFNTDKDVSLEGFKITYIQQSCGLGSGNSGCGTKKLFTSNCGEITFQQNNDGSFGQCEWLIQLNSSLRINMSFTEFMLEDQGINCSRSGLELYDGPDDSGILLGHYCGHRAPFVIYSSSSQVYIRFNEGPLQGSTGFKLKYETYDSNKYQMKNYVTKVQGNLGTLSLGDKYIYSETPEHIEYRWHVRVPYGFHIQLNWDIQLNNAVQFKVIQGVSNHIILEETYNVNQSTINGHIDISYFQAIISMSSPKHNISHFSAKFTAIEWNTTLSHCFSPFYFDNTTSPATENNLVTNVQPVMLKVSNIDSYKAGLYCKWLVRGDGTNNLLVYIIEANIYPVSEDCSYDGFMIYNGSDTSANVLGPFCGSSSLQGITVHTQSSDLLVVFYSDPGYGERTQGMLRALVKQETNDCPVWSMSQPSSKFYEATCGIILSPNFPGIVQQGLWFWTFKAPANQHFSVTVHYVRGPAIQDPECAQSFQIIEVPIDSTEFRQREKHLIKLCGTTDLFIPPGQIKVPPNQKMGIELNTVSNTIQQRWQFKISFTVSKMKTPQQYNVTGLCPDTYTEWRGHCYKYYPWVGRHYRPEEYNWQLTWQRSLEQCERENGTFLTIHDEEEAYFIKYQLAHSWFWNPSSPYGTNHRFIYLGLHNKDGEYEWTSEVKLSYADWYKPQPDWAQDLFFGDSALPEIINKKLRQPVPNSGSLCSGMVNVSPFGSMNWVKIPCDFPMFRAGAICKQPVKGIPDPVIRDVKIAHDQNYQVCPDGYFMMSNECITVLSNYMKNDNSSTVTESFNMHVAGLKCKHKRGSIPYNIRFVNELKVYLDIWNYTSEYGSILVGKNSTEDCMVLKPVYKDYEHCFEELMVKCDSRELSVKNVVCKTSAVDTTEECGEHEFTCDNQACVCVDSVCDGIYDCTDMSDERDCTCDTTRFQCNNGRCISLSLRCDYIDNCGDMSDETGCIPEGCSDSDFTCDNSQCIPRDQICNFEMDCIDGSDESTELCAGKCPGFQCFSGRCLNSTLRNDGISDCPGLLFEDESTFNTAQETFFQQWGLEEKEQEEDLTVDISCAEGDTYTKCHQDESTCYNRNKVCVYDTKISDEARNFQIQSNCRDGFHLRKNCDNIQCPSMFHCPGSYCIPLRKVCDGVKDCPSGKDEQNCQQYSCPGFFKCKISGVCIPHSEVCNGVDDCGVYKEDEKYCGHIDPICEQCQCQGYLANCHNRNMIHLPTTYNKTRPIRALYLDFNYLRLDETSFVDLHWLSKLNLSYNLFKELKIDIFKTLLNLEDLDLSHNLLSFVDSKVFTGLGQLKRLDLSYNVLHTLVDNSFSMLMSLKKIVIENNPYLDNVHPDSFAQLSELSVLKSDAYKFCCIAPQVDVCTPLADEFSNCEDLMANYPLQISIWVLGLVATFGNIFVVIWRVATDRESVSSVLIMNLGCSDFLMGVYMLIIASVDVHYRGNYIVYADNWRNSTLCQIAGILAMLSSEVSVYMLTAITVERCVAIMFPLKFGKIRMKHAKAIIAIGWIVCMFLSILPATKIDYFGDAFFGSTGVCLPFLVSNIKLPGWEYSAFIFLVLNFTSFILIFVCYTGIFMTVLSSVKNMGTSASNSADEYAIAKKLMIIVATDFCCWVPIILIGFAALGGAIIPPQVSAWIAVFILPLNSAVNPILYTVSNIQCKKKKNKRGAQYSQKTSSTKITKSTSG